jgi:hypothetical protein
VQRFRNIYQAYAHRVDYIVVLPMMPVGRAAGTPPPNTEALLQVLGDMEWSKLAFGSGFWDWLKTRPEIPAVLYPPEIMSKYVLLDAPVKVYNNSHEMRECVRVRRGDVMPPIPLLQQQAAA